MNSVSIRFSNSNEMPIYVQVDPWAGVYVLEPGEEIEIFAESASRSPSFSINEYHDSRILTICNSDEYFVVRDGHRIHWSEFATNLES